MFPIDLDIGYVVLEDSWDVDLSIGDISFLSMSFSIHGSRKPSQIREDRWNQERLRLARSPVVEEHSIPLERCLWKRR